MSSKDWGLETSVCALCALCFYTLTARIILKLHRSARLDFTVVDETNAAAAHICGACSGGV